MEIVNNSTIESVIDYANVKFGLELNKDDIAEQLKGLSFGDTLKLIDSIKKDKAIVNYGNFKTQISLTEIELVKAK